ncbi:MAG: right-handed parallel beta-helix repeat-containing protein [Verrucomicrobiota bacterium]
MKLLLPLAALLLSLPPRAAAQGSLIPPPGVPAPTMKTLDQVEPRKEVNATNTPGDATYQFIISSPGSYYLGGNLTGVAGKHGIRIGAADVTLDLKGFSLIGTAGSLSAIHTFGGGKNLRLRDGIIREWGSDGANCQFAQYPVYENLHFYKNGVDGFKPGGGSIIRNCVSSYNLGAGFTLGGVGSSDGGVNETADDGIIESCFATGNGGDGFQVRGVVMTGCEARLNTGYGLKATSPSTVSQFMAIGNTGDGIFVAAGSTLTGCTARDNTGANGILVGEGSTLTNCTASSNDVEYGINADDRCTLTNCTSNLNTSDAADSRGIFTAAQCTITQCTADGNLNTNATPSNATGGGILAGASSTIQNCTVVGNKGDGIQISSDSRVVGNNCDSNGFSGGNAAGIHSTGSDNRIEGNNVSDNTRGIDVDSSGTLIIKNSAATNAINYEIAGNNVFGEIVNRTALLVAAVSGSAAVSSAGTTDPWANFSY